MLLMMQYWVIVSRRKKLSTSWTNKFGQAKEAVEAGVMVDLKALESKMEE
jgi:hypothetical protein